MRVLWRVARILLQVLGALLVLTYGGWRLLGWRMRVVDEALAETERKLPK